MSTMMDSVAGKGRSLSTNAWLALLIGSLVVFAGNTLYATTKASRLGGASTSASRLQLNSQRLANQGREAIEGNADAFAAFKDTKAEVDQDIKSLNDRFGSSAGVSGPINTVSNTWAPLAKRADEVLASQTAVLALAGRADSFTNKVPQLQAQLNEVVRGLASGGASSGQVFTALQQVVTSAAMARRIAELQAGGSGAQVAAGALGRDSAVFDRSMNALRNGGGDIAKVTAAGALGPLSQANTLWQDMKKDLDAIVGSSKDLIGAQTSVAAVTTGSEKLLADSENLFAAFRGSARSGGTGRVEARIGIVGNDVAHAGDMLVDRAHQRLAAFASQCGDLEHWTLEPHPSYKRRNQFGALLGRNHIQFIQNQPSRFAK